MSTDNVYQSWAGWESEREKRKVTVFDDIKNKKASSWNDLDYNAFEFEMYSEAKVVLNYF
jgi:hypothetical protein